LLALSVHNDIRKLAWSQIRADVTHLTGDLYQRSSRLIYGGQQYNWQFALLGHDANWLNKIGIVRKYRSSVEFMLKRISH
jgi:hypothetical protein